MEISFLEELTARMDRMNTKARIRDRWKDDLVYVNNFSSWYPNIQNLGFRTPRSYFKTLSLDEFEDLGLLIGMDEGTAEDYKKAKDNILNNVIKQAIAKYNPAENERYLFMKNGAFSNKFDFATCKIDLENDTAEDILEKYLVISETSALFSTGGLSELVIREFIESDEETETIYNGMPFRLEFRVFYDFDGNQPLYAENYWNFNACYPTIESNYRNAKETPNANEDYVKSKKHDHDIFLKTKDSMHKAYMEKADEAMNYIDSVIKESKVDHELDGVWSVDLMYEDGKFYLIDMAEGHRSAYYDPEKIAMALGLDEKSEEDEKPEAVRQSSNTILGG